MIQASQKAVFQQTNVVLTQIRQVEVQYFSDFFSNFGTQCILLAGYICGAVSQTPGFGANCNYFWQISYNLGSAGCVAYAIQGLLGSIFISVFGQGLALRGPQGSMVAAIEGMVQEQHRAVYYFIGAAVCFAIQEIGMCWIMMDTPGAIVCTVIIALYGIYTYRAALRIYNRFYWDQGTTKFREAKAEEELDDLHPEPTVPNSTKSQRSVVDDSSVSSESDKKSGKRSVNLTKLFTGKSSAASASATAQSEQRAAEKLAGPRDDAASEFSDTPYVDLSAVNPVVPVSGANTPPGSTLALQGSMKVGGYLTVKVKKPKRLSSMVVGRSDPWERRYFVLRGQLMYYYQDKRAFDLEPQKPLNSRPIDLEGYRLEAVSESQQSPPYQLSLVPASEDDVRRAWDFRCDTLNEFRHWLELLGQALRLMQSSSGKAIPQYDDDE